MHKNYWSNLPQIIFQDRTDIVNDHERFFLKTHLYVGITPFEYRKETSCLLGMKYHAIRERRWREERFSISGFSKNNLSLKRLQHFVLRIHE